MKTISRDELTAKLGSTGTVILNVLAAPAYDKIHIKGSISMPRFDLEAGRWKELDKAKEIVVYCSSYECTASKASAEFLEDKGYDVKAYEGGLKEWAESGLPTEGSVTAEQFLLTRYGKPASWKG